MRYAGLIKNDIAAGQGVCVTFFTQGCPRHCYQCHNPETWAFDGGYEFTQNTLDNILQTLQANNVQRNFSVMGGEPLCDENLFLTHLVIKTVREHYPNITIYLWTGYTKEELDDKHNSRIDAILDLIDVLIDGPFIYAERDITLPMRGSRNQRIICLTERGKHDLQILD